MKFYSVTYPKSQQTIALLEKACSERGVEHQLLNPAEFNYLEAPQLPPGDAVYRGAADRPGRLIEKYIITTQTATLYQSYERALQLPTNFSYVIHDKEGIPIPATFYHVNRNRSQLRQYVDHLGGFPVILKATGGSHGIGVMKIDSLPSLFSIVDHLVSEGNTIIMRKFITTNSHARLIVIGTSVIDSIEYLAPPDDFRTNVEDKPTVTPRRFERKVEAIAVKAVRSLGLEFGGVDVIFDPEGLPYVTEVNFPCNFARAQLLTGVDIAGDMVDFLANKASRLTA